MTLNRLTGISGLLGSFIVLAGAFLTAVEYRGDSGETYSPLNHFVSELGELHVSAWAPLYNGSLIAGNACLVIFMLGVASRFRGSLRWVFGALGLISTISGGLIGVFPMNHLTPHLIVAMTCFVACLASSTLFWIHSLVRSQRRNDRWIAWPSFVTTLCFAVFVAESFHFRNHLGAILRMLSHRPAIWFLPLTEWMAFLSVFFWIMLMAWHFGRGDRLSEES